MSVVTLRRTESPFSGARGQAMFRRSWLPADPERVVLLVHGFAEHSGRYEHVAAWLAARGCSVHAYDQVGHGRSSGPRGHVGRFAEFLDDLDLFLDAVRREHPGLPVFIVGHSMGGLVVATHARERQPEVAGVALSAPALMVHVPRRVQLLARFGRRVAPRASRPANILPQWLSRDPQVVKAYVADPLVFDRLTTSLGWELFSAARRTLDGGADVRVPTLMLHGEDDRLCSVEGSRRFARQLTVPGRQLVTYPELYHEIFNEPEQAVVFRDLLDWITARKPASGSAA